MENVSRFKRLKVYLKAQPTIVRVSTLVVLSIAAGFVIRFNGALAALAWLVLAVAIITSLVWVFAGLLKNSKRSSLFAKVVVAATVTFVLSFGSLGAHALGTTLATTASPYSAEEIADQERQAVERAEREAQEAAERAEREAQEAAERAEREAQDAAEKAEREREEAAEEAAQASEEAAENAEREREEAAEQASEASEDAAKSDDRENNQASANSDATSRESSGSGFSWRWPWASEDIVVFGSIRVPPQYVAYVEDGTYDSDAKIREGAECKASSGFSDIRRGGQVVVTDRNGGILGAGELSDGTQVRSGLTKQFVVTSRSLYGSNPSICEFTFSFEVPGGKKLYNLSVGNSFRGEILYTEEELAFGVALELGP